MQAAELPLSYGLFAPEQLEAMRVLQEHFPNAESTCVYGGCAPLEETRAIVWICPQCVRGAREWIAITDGKSVLDQLAEMTR